MKLPFVLVIQDQKLTDYLLVFQEKDDKSQYLALAGYSKQNWQKLKSDILTAVGLTESFEQIPNEWGSRFKVRSEWNGPSGKLVRVISIWQQDEGSDAIRFVTLYPDK